jgi:hypothetical protein
VKKVLAVLAATAGLGLLSAAPSQAAGQLCYDVNIQVADQAPIAQTGCQDIPTP